jgi:hypothetical protein
MGLQRKHLNIISWVAAAVLVAITLAPLAGTSRVGAPSPERMTNPGDYDLAKDIFAKMAAHDTTYIRNNADVEIMDAHLPATLDKLAAKFPQVAPSSVTLVGYTSSKDPGDATVLPRTLSFLRLEYEYPNKQLLIGEIALSHKADYPPRIAGIHVVAEQDTLDDQVKFCLSGMDRRHYGVLALALADLLFSAGTLAFCIRTAVPKWKGAWIVAVLIGFFGFRYNWQTGMFALSWFPHLPPAGFLKIPYQPVIATVTFPIGAIAFLVMWWKWQQAPKAKKTSKASKAPPPKSA